MKVLATAMMELHATTPNKYRYKAFEEQVDPALTDVYVRKEALGKKPPKQLCVSVIQVV